MNFGNKCLMSNFPFSKNIGWKVSRNTLTANCQLTNVDPCQTGFILRQASNTGLRTLTDDLLLEARKILCNSSYWISLQDLTLLITKYFCPTSKSLMGVDWNGSESSFITYTWELLWAAAPVPSEYIICILPYRSTIPQSLFITSLKSLVYNFTNVWRRNRGLDWFWTKQKASISHGFPFIIFSLHIRWGDNYQNNPTSSCTSRN